MTKQHCTTPEAQTIPRPPRLAGLAIALTVAALFAMKPLVGVAAGVVQAASASYADVSAAVAAASSGDTVVVPAGTATWSKALKITKGITLQGAGIGKTVINSAVPGSYDYSSAVLISYDPANPLLNEPVRITGFTLDGNWTSGCVSLFNTPYSTAVPITRVRVDHNRFQECGNTSYPARALMVDGLTFGVADNNVFVDNQKTADFEMADSYGWAIPANLGGPNSFYFEDNVATNVDTRASLFTSGGQGGRYVLRFNTYDGIKNSGSGQHFDVHGTLTDRGTVSAEIYNNVLYARAGSYQFVDLRGSQARIFDNRVIKSSSDIYIDLREEDGTSYPARDQIANTYMWQNTYGTSTGTENKMPWEVTAGATFVKANRDFWVDTPSFNGTSGMGVGPRASRPAACTTGVGYWATDEGEWNSTNGSQPDGRLYRCSTTNVWTLYYTPYTYPHPLRNGFTSSGSGGSAPVAPANLRIVPQS